MRFSGQEYWSRCGTCLQVDSLIPWWWDWACEPECGRCRCPALLFGLLCTPHLPPRWAGAEAGGGLLVVAAQVSKALKGYLLTLALSSCCFFVFFQEVNAGVYFRFIHIHFQQSLRAIQLVCVSLSAPDDFASGGLQENPQVGSKTWDHQFPFLLVDFSGLPVHCSYLGHTKAQYSVQT